MTGGTNGYQMNGSTPKGLYAEAIAVNLGDTIDSMFF